MGFGKDRKGVIFRQNDEITLLTLGSGSVLTQDNVPATSDSLRIIKSEGSASVSGATLVEGDGPIALYLASNDLTVAEIAAVINPAGGGAPLNRDDIVGNDVTMRPVYYLGHMEFVPIGVGGSVMMEWSRTIRWTFGDSTGFAIVAFNEGSALTTGGKVSFSHRAFGVWVGA